MPQETSFKTHLKNRLAHWRRLLSLKIHEILRGLLPGNYLTYHARPKFAHDVQSVSTRPMAAGELALIVQGPLTLKHNFTLESVRLYRKLFPGASIIVSTWEGEDNASLEALRAAGADIVLNRPPAVPGPYNINFQLLSTQSALSRARQSGFRYAFKTRSDQRCYRQDLFAYFTALLKTFPLAKACRQKERLITSSFSTCKYRIYGITDFMMFGTTEDMSGYWGAESYENGIKPYIDPQKKETPPVINGIPVIAEMYLAAKYLEWLGETPQWTIQHYWNVLRDYFCVVDGYALDVYWDKYFKLQEYRYTRDYRMANPRAMEFADWLQLYAEGRGRWEGVRSLERWTYDGGTLKIVNL